MTCTGVIRDGMVVLDNGSTIPEGTRVRIETFGDVGNTASADVETQSFWRATDIEELARTQGVSLVRSLDAVLGGWPDDELEDGFEQAVQQWRSAELEQGG